MRSSARMLAIAIVLSALPACATLRGSQDTVPELAPRTLVPVETALFNYHMEPDSARHGMSRRAYRDYIASSYSSAIDARYRAFVDQLSSSDRGSALGIDLLLLGLTGATALVAETAVDELATVSAIAAGAGATIDKRLFFDRTLPALIASMDAERAVIRAEIARKRGSPVERYSLDEAIDDLRRLQDAGRLDRAVARVTRIAEADRAAQQARLDAITTACDDISGDADALNRRFRELLQNHPDSAERYRVAADELGIDVIEGTALGWADVRAVFDVQLCDDAMKREFIERLELRFNQAAEGGDGGAD